MVNFTRGFKGRRERDPRLPPGQYDAGHTWPVLTAEATPKLDTDNWTFTVEGLVARPTSWTWQEIHALPESTYHGDIYCVTTWSKLGMVFSGISVDSLLAVAQPLPAASYVVAWSHSGYTTNLPLAPATNPGWPGKSAARPSPASTAAQPASSSPTCSFGKAPNGSPACASSTTTNPASGNRTATTTGATPGYNSATKATDVPRPTGSPRPLSTAAQTQRPPRHSASASTSPPPTFRASTTSSSSPIRLAAAPPASTRLLQPRTDRATSRLHPPRNTRNRQLGHTAPPLSATRPTRMSLTT
jgi:hypothetical protein